MTEKEKEFDIPTEITNQCPFCGKTHIVVVDFDDLLDWKQGKLALYAFPYLNPIEREQIISSICPKCQEDFF